MILSVKRYAERIMRICETQNVIIIILFKQLKKQNKILNIKRNYKKGKRIKLNGVITYNIFQVLEIARKKKETRLLKRSRVRLRKRFIKEVKVESEDKISEILFINSAIILEQSVGRRTRSRK